MVDLPIVQNLVASWWYDYDQGDVDVWPAYFTSDAHFSCRSDSGRTEFEEFIRADVSGRDAVVAWQVEHRDGSPYPLRHNGTDAHLTATRPGEADFRSYIFVTHIVDMAVTNLSSGLVVGTVRAEDGRAWFADMRVVLDFTTSVPFTGAVRNQPA